MLRDQPHTPTSVCPRILLLEFARNRFHLSLRLLPANAGLEAADDAQRTRVAVGQNFCVNLSDRDPQRSLFGELKSGRHYADHFKAFPIERQRLPNRLRGGAEALAPQSVADQNYRVCLSTVVFSQKDATDRGLHS